MPLSFDIMFSCYSLQFRWPYWANVETWISLLFWIFPASPGKVSFLSEHPSIVIEFPLWAFNTSTTPAPFLPQSQAHQKRNASKSWWVVLIKKGRISVDAMGIQPTSSQRLSFLCVSTQCLPTTSTCASLPNQEPSLSTWEIDMPGS